MSFDSSDARPLRGLFVSTAAIALVASVGALGLVHHLARTVDRPGSRMASLPRGIVDPDVTGSIGSPSIANPSLAKPSIGAAARSVVLDPCTGNERLVVRGP